MGYEFEVSRKSFWARYEGLTTCNARGVYLLIALAILVAFAIVAIFVWGLFNQFWNTMAVIGVIACILALVFLEIITISYGRSDPVQRFFDKPAVNNFFKYGFIWLWWPLVMIKMGLSFVVRICAESVSALYRRCFKPKELTPEERQARWIRDDAREARKIDNESIRGRYWEEEWKSFLTHTILLAVILGNLLAYCAPPERVTTIWSFPLFLLFSCFTSWIIVTLAFVALIHVFLPPLTRLERKFPFKDSRVFKFWEGLKHICSDMYHHVCRLIVVNDYEFGGLPMRRVFSESEIAQKFGAGVYRVLLLSARVSHCEKTAWKLVVKDDDAEARSAVEGKAGRDACCWYRSDDGFLFYSVRGEMSFSELYPRLR